jgi:Tol biopolymer transport system component
MKYKLLVSILLFLFITQVSAALASPVISIDETVTENMFYAKSYTNPDSIEAHQIAVYSEDGEHSQIHLHYTLTPRTTVSPDGNYSVYMKALDSVWGIGVEDYVINDTVAGTETNIKNIITMGYYAVAFSPDSKMYAAPRAVFFEGGRNARYAIDICSVHNNTLLHRELTPFYIESTKATPMEWEKSAIYEVYWSDDGSSIVYEVLGGNTESGQYPAYLVTKRLNLDYTELRKMNGYEDTELESVNEDVEETNTAAENSLPTPGFGALGALFALALGRKIKRA